MNYTQVSGCRSCGGQLQTVLDLGKIHINAFLKPGEPDTEQTPLALAACKKCSLVQLWHTVNPDVLFKKFWYRSGITASMRDAMADLVYACIRNTVLKKDDIVLDIASNDGTLLRAWKALDGRDHGRIGFDPAENLAEEASEGGATICTDYFSAHAYFQVTQRKATAITCAAMFYDLDNPNAFLQDVRAVLADDGVFVCQLSYLPDMLATNDFPAICQEHLCYYSLTSLMPLFARNGLNIYDVEFNAVNGGSVRVFADHGKRAAASSVQTALGKEERKHIASFRAYQLFGERVQEAKMETMYRLKKYAAEGPVYFLGASTKGQILAQYYGITKELVSGASERDARKHGLEMVGSRIPIVSEEEARAKAKTMFVLPWPFADEIKLRERPWLLAGGRLLFAQPKVYVVE
jgi:SAM-dependent methyltransferase